MPVYTWTAPVSRATLYVVTAADWDNLVYGDLNYFYGDGSWTTMTGFTNSWSSLGSPYVCRYQAVGNNVVVQGRMTGGTLNTAAFTFPAGYRPTETTDVATNANGAFGVLTITSAGVLTLTVGSTTGVSISCIFSTL